MKLSYDDQAVERAAKVIGENDPLQSDREWKDFGFVDQQVYRRVAREALEAALAQQGQPEMGPICAMCSAEIVGMVGLPTQPEMPTREMIAEALKPLTRSTDAKYLVNLMADAVLALFAPKPLRDPRKAPGPEAPYDKAT